MSPNINCYKKYDNNNFYLYKVYKIKYKGHKNNNYSQEGLLISIRIYKICNLKILSLT